MRHPFIPFCALAGILALGCSLGHGGDEGPATPDEAHRFRGGR